MRLFYFHFNRMMMIWLQPKTLTHTLTQNSIPLRARFAWVWQIRNETSFRVITTRDSDCVDEIFAMKQKGSPPIPAWHWSNFDVYLIESKMSVDFGIYCQQLAMNFFLSLLFYCFARFADVVFLRNFLKYLLQNINLSVCRKKRNIPLHPFIISRAHISCNSFSHCVFFSSFLFFFVFCSFLFSLFYWLHT